MIIEQYSELVPSALCTSQSPDSRICSSEVSRSSSASISYRPSIYRCARFYFSFLLQFQRPLSELRASRWSLGGKLGDFTFTEQQSLGVQVGALLNGVVVRHIHIRIHDRSLGRTVACCDMPSFVCNDECNAGGLIMPVAEHHDRTVFHHAGQTLKSGCRKLLHRQDRYPPPPQVSEYVLKVHGTRVLPLKRLTPSHCIVGGYANGFAGAQVPHYGPGYLYRSVDCG